MYSIARLPEDERRILFRNTAQKMGMNEAMGQSQILCKLQNVAQIEQNLCRAGTTQAVAHRVYKITVLRGDVKGGGVSLRSSRPLTSRRTVGQSGIRSAKNTASCAWIMLQSCRRPVHFFVISTMARYSIFSRLSSVGKTDFALVTFRSCRLKPSIALVV